MMIDLVSYFNINFLHLRAARRISNGNVTSAMPAMANGMMIERSAVMHGRLSL